MNATVFDRLRALRMENDEVRCMQESIRPRFERMANRHENGTAPRAVSAYQLFQTPRELAYKLAAMLRLSPGKRVLEPSAGLGNLVAAVSSYQPSEIVAVDVSPECTGELYRQNRPGVVIKQRDFLELTPDDIGLFDAVIMNPPFHMRSDILHIKHALEFLKPRGKLAAICLNGYQREELKFMASEWVELERGTFKTSGTNVPTVMLTINKGE